MSEVKNNKENVSSAKGVDGGYLFVAPVKTVLPTDLTSPLNESFVTVGFITEDGLSFPTETEADEFKDLNGDVIHSSTSSHSEKMVATLAEVKKTGLELVYGDGNVEDANGVLSVKNKGADRPHRSYVFEGVLKNGRRWRRVIPDAMISELGDLVAASAELFAREATFTIFKDAEGVFFYDYFTSTETTPATPAEGGN